MKRYRFLFPGVEPIEIHARDLAEAEDQLTMQYPTLNGDYRVELWKRGEWVMQ